MLECRAYWSVARSQRAAVLVADGAGRGRDRSDDPVAQVREALAQAGLEAEVTGSQPDLEDVFVAATDGSDHQARAA